MPTTEHHNHCPLSYCDPHACGWRAGHDTCDWVENALRQGAITEDDDA